MEKHRMMNKRPCDEMLSCTIVDKINHAARAALFVPLAMAC